MHIKYRTIIQQRRLGERLFVLETIAELDEAIDQICLALGPEAEGDPFAEDLCPYFGILWPAAEGLAHFLHQHPQLLQQQRVLELGAGLGFPSLVARSMGAQVLATDYHPEVEAFFLRNCRHSMIDCQYQRLNWRSLEEQQQLGQFDIVMGSDILYESQHPSEIVQALRRYLAPGGKILLADPGRAYLQNFVTAMQTAGFQEQLHPVVINGQEIFVFLFTATAE
jgi:predicted nicotinamide N-methyase